MSKSSAINRFDLSSYYKEYYDYREAESRRWTGGCLSHLWRETDRFLNPKPEPNNGKAIRGGFKTPSQFFIERCRVFIFSSQVMSSIRQYMYIDLQIMRQCCTAQTLPNKRFNTIISWHVRSPVNST